MAAVTASALSRTRGSIVASIRRMVVAVVLCSLLAVTAVVAMPHRAAAQASAAVHPSIAASSEKFAQIRRDISAGEGAQVFAALRKRAEELLNSPRLEYKKDDGVRISAVSQSLLERTYTLGLMWRLTNETRFAERLWLDAGDVAAFPDWNPDHFLDTAEITHAMAIALDWGYDYWSASRRSTLQKSIGDKGLRPALPVYAAPATSSGPYKSGGNWAVDRNNWNIISNSGMIMGALAIADVNPILSQDVLQKATASIRNGISAIADDGGYPEGLLYWDYSMRHLLPSIESLRVATGNDQGLLTTGVRNTGYFPLHLTAPSGAVFNYGDADQTPTAASHTLGIANLDDDPVLHQAGIAATQTGLLAQKLLWANFSAPRSTPTAGGTPLDGRFSAAGVSTFRSSWSDSSASYVAFKTGNVVTGHQNLDAGSFMLDMLGQTWGTQLGRDDYNLAGYFDQTDTGRWSYYRARAEGQNTLVIDPYNPYLSNPRAVTAPPTVVTSADRATAISDLTSMYPGRITSWRRGVQLFDSRRQVLVQDEVTSEIPVESIWAMHTEADPKIAADGRSAILTKGGKQILARVIAPADGTFSDLPAAPLPTSPTPTQNANRAIRKLSISVSARTEATIAVQFTPLETAADQQTPSAALEPLSKWVTNSETPVLTGITVNGQLVPDFRADVPIYRVLADPGAELPIVQATTTGASTQIDQAQSVPGRAIIRATTENGKTAQYSVTFQPGPVKITNATASRTTAGTPMNTADQNPATYWSTWTENSITWQIAGKRDVAALEIDWRANSQQLTNFEVQTSSDQTTWETRFSGVFRGPSGTQSIRLSKGAEAQYVRLTGSGAGQADPWTAINDVRILAFDPTNATTSPTPRMISSVDVTGLPQTMTLGEDAVLSVTAKTDTGQAVPSTDYATRIVSSSPNTVSVGAAGTATAIAPGQSTVGAVVEMNRVWSFGRTQPVVVSDPTRLRVFASGDAYVQGGGSAGSNFGSLTNVLVKGSADPAYARLGYLSFDLSGVKGQVESAVLSVNAGVTESSTAGVRLDFKSVTGAWGEGTLTFNNKPAFGATVASMNVDRTVGYRSADLTGYVRSQLDAGSRVASLGVTQDSTPQLVTSISSKESANRPYIDLILKPPALPIASATATKTTSGSAAATFDANTSTGWTTLGDQSITWTLADARPVKSARINWASTSTFAVQTSTDGVTWATQYDGSYAGNPGWQTIVLAAAPSGKLIRITTHNGSATSETKLQEIQFYTTDITRQTDAPPAGILRNIDIGAAPGLNLDENFPLSISAYSTTGARLGNEGISLAFASADAGVASVNGSGVVSAVKAGSTQITVTASFNGTTVTQSVPVVVSDPTRLRVFASGDAYVQGGGSAGSNFGSLTNVLVKGSADPAYARLGYLSFDLSGVKGQVESAVLSVNAGVTESSTAGVRLDFKSVTGAWGEGTLTFNNKPAFGATVASMNVDRTVGYRSADLTGYVRSQLDAGSRVASLGVTQDSTPQLVTSISSKESANRPYIDLILKPPTAE